MSGRGTGPDVIKPEPDCDGLVFTSVLTDVDPAVAAAVTVGEVLEIALVEDRYPVAQREGARLGSITSGQLGALVRCVRDDGPFVAQVLTLDGGWIEVQVRHG